MFVPWLHDIALGNRVRYRYLNPLFNVPMKAYGSLVAVLTVKPRKLAQNRI